MGKYTQLAMDIIQNVGGKENIRSLTHCITRLRFQLVDEGRANDGVLKKMDGVVTVMKSGGQYQVVIGNHVPEVYADVCAIAGIGETAPSAEAPAQKKNLFDAFIDTVSGIFQPILGIMAACGMVKGLNALFVALGLYPDTCGAYLIFNAVGDGLFHFLPLFLGYTAAKKFGLKPMIGLVIGAIMCYPGVQGSALSAGGELLYTLFRGSMFESGIYTTFFGIPMIAMDYTGTVIPVIFVVYFAAKCERFFSRLVPDLVKFFFVPMLTLLVVIPAGFLVIGPLATFGSTIIAEFVMTVRNFSPMIAGAIVGLTWQILVIFGLHWGFIPVYINNIMTNGYGDCERNDHRQNHAHGRDNQVAHAAARLNHGGELENAHAAHRKFAEIERAVEAAADTARNAADNKRFFQRQQNTVNRRLGHAENAGNKVWHRHILELAVLGLEPDCQHNRRGRGSDDDHCIRNHHGILEGRSTCPRAGSRRSCAQAAPAKGIDSRPA